LFALVGVGTGTELHRLANGSDPTWVGPALALPLLYLAAFGLARRERSAITITLALGVAQLGLHIELGWFCPKTMVMPGTPSSDHGMSTMILAHVVAVLISGLWLSRGEKAFFQLCRTLALLAAPAADLLLGRLVVVVLPLPLRGGIHVTAPRTTSPPEGPAPSPRVLRGPPMVLCS
jgi:hypothetical protein